MRSVHPYTRTLSDTLAAAGALRQRLSLCLQDIGVLSMLATDGPLSMGALASLLGVSKAAMTSCIDRLESIGYLERQADPHDRRLIPITLTDAGYDVLHQAITEEFGNG